MFKKIVFLIVLFCFCFFAYSPIYALTWDQYNQYLVTLLGDETDPFFSDTVRHHFLRMGVKSVASVCRVGEYQRLCYVPAICSEITFPTITDTFHNIIGVEAIWRKDSSYAIPNISDKDVGRKSIATATELQYWYNAGMGTNTPKVFIYPPQATADSVLVFIYGTPHIEYMNPAYDHLVILGALQLCYLRQREPKIARFIENIFNSLLYDMYAITEGRQVDVTIKKKVIP